MKKKNFRNHLLNTKILLSNKLYGFFSRNGGISLGNFSSLNCAFSKYELENNTLENRKIVCKALKKSLNELVLVNQIHSNKVVEINLSNKYKEKNADGMITKSRGIILGILTADCAPIIFIGKEYIGIIHVGWKGLFSGIINKTINLLLKRGEKAEEIFCFIGPHIRSESFQIREDFKKKVLLMDKENSKFVNVINNEMFFDFTMFMYEELKKNNICNVSISEYNTYCNPKLFFSYRYSKQNGIDYCGRQISVVSIL